MHPDLKETFSRIIPKCDAVMMCPSLQTMKALQASVLDIKTETMNEMQLYVLFPVISHLKSPELKTKYELQRHLVDTMRMVIERAVISSLEMFSKYHGSLLSLLFDKSLPGMVAQGPEEWKLSITECLTAAMLSADYTTRKQLFESHVPLLAQTVFISVHLAKNEKLRSLRLKAIECVTAYTATHHKFTRNHKLLEPDLEPFAAEMVGAILPGVASALHDVATSVDNPGHAVVAEAVRALHYVICLVMNDIYLKHKSDVTTEDFARIFQEKANVDKSKEKNIKELPRKCPEWFAMAGKKLQLVIKSVASLQTHEHEFVRRTLAVLCSRILLECSRTMQASVSTALDVLISLSKDEFPELSRYCLDKLEEYFRVIPEQARCKALDSLADGFLATVHSLPSIMNNIDSSRKLSSLNLLHGYLSIMSSGSCRPARITVLLSVQHTLLAVCRTLIELVRMDTHVGLMAATTDKYVEMRPATNSPWCILKHIDDEKCHYRVIEICRLLGETESADLIVDQLIDLFSDSSGDRKEIVYLLNYIATASSTNTSLLKRVLEMYIDPSVWYLSLDVATTEPPLTSKDTLDLSIYNPRQWDKDTVPGLYEGTVETRYTDISYCTPRAAPHHTPRDCVNLSQALHNMVVCCAVTEGVGQIARCLAGQYQPYLLRTLCPILERIGSGYEMLHYAGVMCLRDVAAAGGHNDVKDLIQHNADYFTHQVTTRLKKAWNCQSALQILCVVMEYSDVTILDCLYGIVNDVLIQSCDKYHDKELTHYLQVFLTFIESIRLWFHIQPGINEICPTEEKRVNVFTEVKDYILNKLNAELLDEEEMSGDVNKSAEEMYKEDMINQEENNLNYDDKVTEEKQPSPRHIEMTVTVMKRCLNFVPSKRTNEKLLSLRILRIGLSVLADDERELLPMIHQIWSPLVERFKEEPIIVRRALKLLVTMADLAKDFIASRTVKEVLPILYNYLRTSSVESELKDIGSAYRDSQQFKLQLATLSALATLAVDLQLENSQLETAMDCAALYLSVKQPRPLQEIAVRFFRNVLEYDHGATWWKLRELCDNDCEIVPPRSTTGLKTVVGAPYYALDTLYGDNIDLIFGSDR